MSAKRFLLPALLAASLQSASALDLNTTDPSSIRSTAATIASGVLSYYKNANATGESVGLFPFLPYYWWESGGAWGSLINYWSYTGDNNYTQEIMDAIAAQVGENYDFVVAQQASNEANDDQGFWVFNALEALEQGLPALPCPNGTTSGDNPGDLSTLCPTAYLKLADSAFNLYVQRYNNDSATCNGGLKWQYNPALAGYTYKNSISNGVFFSMAARLARYTGNATYTEWAQRIYNWESSVGFISPTYNVYDGAGDANGANCSEIDKDQWSYNLGVWMYGAATMADANNAGNDTSNLWTQRVQGFVDTANATFFSPFPNATGIMYENVCEEAGKCNNDEVSFKAYLARWMGKTAQVIPVVADMVNGLLATTAPAAATSCSGPNNACGTKWYIGGYDGMTGLGQQLTALEAVQGLLAGSAPKPARLVNNTLTSRAPL